MEQNNPQGVDIKSKDKPDDLIAPTPNNTPIVTAPVQTLAQPKMAGSFAPNAALVSDLQGRLGSLVGASSGYVESLPAEVQRRLQGLKSLQADHAKLETEFHKEIFALEKKYQQLYQPLYTERTAIVLGNQEPTDAQVTAGKAIEAEDGTAAPAITEESDSASPLTGVPEFWLTAMKNHSQLEEMIQERDEDVLKHLTDIGLQYLDGEHAFRLVFSFAPNDFFTNSQLTKTYYYETNSALGDIVFDHAEGDQIDWKEGKDLTVAVESRKQRNKHTNETRVVKKTVPAESFFTFFQTVTVPTSPEDDEENFELLQERAEVDYEIGEEFKEKIIPHAVDWFTGKAIEYEGLDMDDYEDDGEDFYGEDSEEDDDDEE